MRTAPSDSPIDRLLQPTGGDTLRRLPAGDARFSGAYQRDGAGAPTHENAQDIVRLSDAQNLLWMRLNILKSRSVGNVLLFGCFLPPQFCL